MGSRLKTVGLAAAMYMSVSALQYALFSLLSRFDSLVAVAALYIVGPGVTIGSLAVISVWVARRLGGRGVLMPVAAYWLGSVCSLFLLHLLTGGHHLAMNLVETASLNLLTAVDPAEATRTLFSLDGSTFSLWIPWPLVFICAAVLWNRLCYRSGSADEGHLEGPVVEVG